VRASRTHFEASLEAGGDLRPPETSVFDEDSSKPDMPINRLSSEAARTDLPARRSVSSRHSAGDSAVPGQMPSGRVPKRVV